MVAVKSLALMKQIVETPTNQDMSLCPGDNTACPHSRPPAPQTWLLITTPEQLCSMSLSYARIARRADSRMRAHDCRSLRERLVPPGVESAGREVHVRRKLLLAQPIVRSWESPALWVELLVRIHFVLFLPLIIEQDQVGTCKCFVCGAITRSTAPAWAQLCERLSLLKP